jgi:hypothetical protein
MRAINLECKENGRMKAKPTETTACDLDETVIDDNEEITIRLENLEDTIALTLAPNNKKAAASEDKTSSAV